MFEVEEAARVITENADPNAKVIFGAVIDSEQVEEGEIKITVVATGFEKPEIVRQQRERYSGSVQFTPPAGMGQARPTAPLSRPMEPLPPPATEAHTIIYPRAAEPMPQDRRVEEEDLDVPTFIRRKMREQKESRSRGEEV